MVAPRASPRAINTDSTLPAAAYLGGAEGRLDPQETQAFWIPETINITVRRSRGTWSPTIVYQRPDVARLLVGQHASIALNRVRVIHSACGFAHQIAFARASEAAGLSHIEIAGRRTARNLRIVLEIAAAHAHRAALELAPACDRPPAIAELKTLMDAIATATRVVDGADSTSDNDSYRRQLAVAFEDVEQAARSLLSSVPPGPPKHLFGQLSPETRGFVAAGWRRPWRFMARMTPVLSRSGLSRQVDIPRSANGRLLDVGLGKAATSRGLLNYEVAFHDGAVTHCKVCTPTMRMTAPGGSLSFHLSHLPASRDTELLAGLVILASDPCAPTRVHFVERAHA